MNELDGENKLVFGGPFFYRLSGGKGAMVQADRLVILSKNGSVADMPVNLLQTTKQKALAMFCGIVEDQQTVAGVDNVLQGGGARMIGKDLFWQKSETSTSLIPIRIEKQKSSSIQKLTKTALET